MNDNQNSSRKVTRLIIILSAVIGILSLYILLAIELPDKPLAGQGAALKDDVQRNCNIGSDKWFYAAFRTADCHLLDHSP